MEGERGAKEQEMGIARTERPRANSSKAVKSFMKCAIHHTAKYLYIWEVYRKRTPTAEEGNASLPFKPE